MNINRNNYETYFLLYVDNELSSADRKIIENFVETNTDLKPELELLLQTALPFEEMIYEGKNDLLRQEKLLKSLQEKLLLHLDNQLQPEAAWALEKQIASDGVIKQEWEILQKTKLNPDNILFFKNKNLLYRYENNNKVIKMRFWKTAVAAAILGFGIFWGVSLFKNENNKINKESAIKINNSPDNLLIKNKIPSFNATDTLNVESIVKEKPSHLHQQKPGIQSQKRNDGRIEKQKINDLTVSPSNKSKQNASNKFPEPIVNNTTSQPENKNILENDSFYISKNNPEPIKANNNPLRDIEKKLEKPLSNNDALEQNNNYVLFMKEETFNRTKIGGWLRKVKNVVDRTVALKNRLQGEFEIAIK